MSTIHRPPSAAISLRTAPRSTRQKALLVCGILAALLYAVSNDLFAALLYPGYSAYSQAVSELTSFGAPTRPALVMTGLLYGLLLVAFGVGVWQCSDGRRSLRVLGGLLASYGALQPLWLPFPQTARGELTETTKVSDVVHMGMAAGTVLVMFVALGLGAATLGRRFRIYSLVTFAVTLAGGGATFAYVPRVDAGQPTPGMGLVERMNIAAWLLWLAVLAVMLLREGRSGSRDASRRRVAAHHDAGR